MSIQNKKVLLVIGGGISAYKALDLIRLFVKNNIEVKTILTKSGKEFVTSLSLHTLTKNKTYEDIFDKSSDAEIDHIALSRWADLIIVMPTTANFMSKLSVGKAEDLATTVLLASNKDVFNLYEKHTGFKNIFTLEVIKDFFCILIHSGFRD